MGLTYLIIGATRGLGLEMAKQLSDIQDNQVIASARSINNAGKLQELVDSRENVKAIEVDVGKDESIAKLTEQLIKVAPSGIDVFIHNAGINIPGASDVTISTPREVWLQQYSVNVVGAIETYKKVYPLMTKKDTRKVIFVSSAAGSFSEFYPVPLGAYGQSKAALNYTVKHIAAELQNERFTVLATHPGLVKTDMGNSGIDNLSEMIKDTGLIEMLKKSAITTEVSISGLLEVIDEVKVEDSGKFYWYDGSVHDY